MEKNIKILPCGTSHAEDISALENIVFAHPWSEASVLGAMENGGQYFAAFSGDTLIGFSGVSIVLDEGQVANIAVHPDFRGQGVGRALAEEMINFCRDSSCLSVTLEVRRGNLPAIKLYESLGFETVGLRRNYYRDPLEDGLLMTLNLGGDIDG